MNMLFLIFYSCLFLWRIPRTGFAKNSGLSATELRLLLCIKWAVALGAAYLFSRPGSNNDYLSYWHEGQLQLKLLQQHPYRFFSELWADVDRYGWGGFFDASFSFWGYLRFHLVNKFAALLSFFSGGHFYVSAILFSTLSFWGQLVFYRIYNSLYPGGKWLKVAACFWIPSLLVSTALIHKDGLVFLNLALVSYLFFKWLQQNKISLLLWVLFFLSLLGILLLRNYILVALLPAMLVAAVLRHSKQKWIKAAFLYVLLGCLFFATGYLQHGANLPQAVVNRKNDFALLEAGSTPLPMPALQPNVGSFVSNAPTALNHVLLQPYLWQSRQAGALFAAIELALYLGLFTLWLFGIVRMQKCEALHAFTLYGIVFFISMVLIIGYTIPNLGAIMRYRSLLWIFIICPMLMQLLRWYWGRKTAPR